MSAQARRRCFGTAVLAGVTLLTALTPGATSVVRAAEDPTSGDVIDITGVDTASFPDVTLDVSAAGAFTGVDPSELVVAENGTVVDTADITATVVPTSGLEVVLLIDTSGSMNEGGAIDAAKQAATRFLEVLPADVAVGVVAFDDQPSLISPLTLDRNLLRAAIGDLRADGETALYDSIVFARSLFSGGTNDRQLVLLSDGGDTVSGATFEQALEAVADVRTSAIELVSSEANHSALEQLAAAGNGTISSATDSAALEGFFQQVAASLVNRYRLTFASSASGTTTFTVSAVAGDVAVEASETVDLPTAPVAPASTVPASAAPVTTTADVVVPESVPPATVDVGSAAAGIDSEPASSSAAMLVLGAGAFFVSFVLLFVMAWPESRSEQRVKQRLGSGLPIAAATQQTMTERVTGAADRMLDKQGRRKGLATALDVAGISLRPGEFVVLSFAAGLVLALVLFSMIGPLGILLGLAATPLLARVAVSAKANKRRAAFADQLPEVLQLLVSSLRTGYGLPQAIDAVASQSPEPTKTELQRVLFEVRIGRDPSDALSATAKRMKSRDFEWVVSAIQINREVGGELAHVLETVAETIRERQRLGRQIQTLTAEGRISAYILIALPIVLALGLVVINPGYFEPMKESPGPLMIVVGVLLLVAGWAWMRRLIKAQY